MSDLHIPWYEMRGKVKGLVNTARAQEPVRAEQQEVVAAISGSSGTFSQESVDFSNLALPLVYTQVGARCPWFAPAVSRPTLGQRATDNTISGTLRTLGYKEEGSRRVVDYRPKWRRSGGKRGGYCPVND